MLSILFLAYYYEVPRALMLSVVLRDNNIMIDEDDKDAQEETAWQIPEDIQDEIDMLIEEQAEFDERVEALDFD